MQLFCWQTYTRSLTVSLSYSQHIPLTLHQNIMKTIPDILRLAGSFILLKRWRSTQIPDKYGSLIYDLNKRSKMREDQYIKWYKTVDFIEQHYKTSCFRTAHYLVQVFTFLYLSWSFRKLSLLINTRLLMLLVGLSKLRSPKFVPQGGASGLQFSLSDLSRVYVPHVVLLLL